LRQFTPYTAYACQQEFLPLYEAAILYEVKQICDSIPHDCMAIQWDVATEMSIFENVYPVSFENKRTILMDQLIRLGNAIPEEADLGYHLCYGSINNRHWKEPEDLGMCVDVSNELNTDLNRPINFIHMPVPIDRNDSAYFSPLGKLRTGTNTEFFLGLVHDQDTEADNRARMETARKYLSKFGIATECGLGRRDATSMPGLMTLHALLAIA